MYRKRKSVPEFLDSIGENGQFIDKTTVAVVGCSNSILVGKNRIQCLEKFFKLQRTKKLGIY